MALGEMRGLTREAIKNLHSKVCNNNATVRALGTVEDVLRLEVTMDNVVGVEISDAVEDGTDHLDGVTLGKLATLGDAGKELAPDGQLEGEVVLFARLEPLVKLDDVVVIKST